MLTDRANWNKFQKTVNQSFLKANYPELATLFHVVDHLYSTTDRSAITLGDLELALPALYPRASIALYRPLLDGISSSDITSQGIIEHIRTLRTREHAAELARKALAVSDGAESLEALNRAIQEFQTDETAAAEAAVEDESVFVGDDLQELIHAQLQDGGLRWRLASLNRALGPLRKGDFGFVFARPETGKTTFLASELSYFAQQATGPIIWFNNEEQGQKVLLRIYCAALGINQYDLQSNVEEYRHRYLELTGGHIRLVDDAALTARKVEQIVHQFQPSLVVFDQIDKIRGFMSDRADLELASIYRWAREIAKQYCPVIGICQSGSTGDGKKWLTMNDVDNSKTGKQAEADWILGIGKTYDTGLEAVRYLHLSKNKLSGGPDSDPNMRHGKWEVKIVPDIARYVDFE